MPQASGSAPTTTQRPWDYRVVRRLVDGRPRLAIHQAFYEEDERDTPVSLSPEPSAVAGDDPAWILARMNEALARPVLDFDSLQAEPLPPAFIDADNRRLVVGLNCKAEAMADLLASLAPAEAADWLAESIPDMPRNGVIAFIRKSPHSDFSVEIPDFPACRAHAPSLEQATTLARQALSTHLEDLKHGGRAEPVRRSWEQLSQAPGRDGAVMAVIVPEAPTEANSEGDA